MAIDHISSPEVELFLPLLAVVTFGVPRFIKKKKTENFMSLDIRYAATFLLPTLVVPRFRFHGD